MQPTQQAAQKDILRPQITDQTLVRLRKSSHLCLPAGHKGQRTLVSAGGSGTASEKYLFATTNPARGLLTDLSQQFYPPSIPCLVV